MLPASPVILIGLAFAAAMLSGCADTASSTEGRPTPIASLVAESGGVPLGRDVVTSGWLRAADGGLWLCPTNAEGPCPEQGLLAGGLFADLDADEYSQEVPGGERVVVAGTLAGDDGAAMLRVTERLGADPDDRVYGPAVTIEVSADLDAPADAPPLSPSVGWNDVEPVVLGTTTGIYVSVSGIDGDTQAERAEIADVELHSESGGVLSLNDAPCGSAESCVAGAVELDTTKAKAGVYPFSLPVTWQQGQHSGEARLDGEIILTPAQGQEDPSGS